MLDDRRRRALIVEAHHIVRGTKDRFISNLSADREAFDGWCMPDRPLTDDDFGALKHLDLAQVAALDKLVEGALGAILFEYLQSSRKALDCRAHIGRMRAYGAPRAAESEIPQRQSNSRSMSALASHSSNRSGCHLRWKTNLV